MFSLKTTNFRKSSKKGSILKQTFSILKFSRGKKKFTEVLMWGQPTGINRKSKLKYFDARMIKRKKFKNMVINNNF